MSISEMKVIHVRRLYSIANVSLDRGRRALRDLERQGKVTPEVTPAGREYITPAEAELLHQALHA